MSGFRRWTSLNQEIYGKSILLLLLILLQAFSLIPALGEKGLPLVEVKEFPSQTEEVKIGSDKYQQGMPSKRSNGARNKEATSATDPQLSRQRSHILRADGQEFISSGSNSFEVTEWYTGAESYTGASGLNSSTVLNSTGHVSDRTDNFTAAPATGYNYAAGSFTLSSLTAIPEWRSVENQSDPTLITTYNSNTAGTGWYMVAMAFEIPVAYANVTEIRVYLDNYLSSARVDAYILNSTAGGTPSTDNADVLSDLVTKSGGGEDWYTFQFSDPATLKRGRTYYVVLNDTKAVASSSYWWWGVTSDNYPSGNGNCGAMYRREYLYSGTWGTEQSYDLLLSVRLLPVTTKTGATVVTYDSNPELALLKYGSTWLNESTDLVDVVMTAVDTHVFTTNISVLFDLTWTRNFTYDNLSPFAAASQFWAKNNSATTWNLTFSAHAISGLDYPLENHTLNVSHSTFLPADWSLTMVYNGTAAYGTGPPEVLYSDGDPYLFINASDGILADSWRVTFTAPNYLLGGALRDSTNTVDITTADRGHDVIVQSRFHGSTTAGGVFNISGFFPNGTDELNLPGKTNVPQSAAVQNETVSLTPASYENGSYVLFVSYSNGTEAGLFARKLLILTPTELTVVDITDALFKGDLLNITVHFNDTSDSSSEVGIIAATLKANPSWGTSVDMDESGTPGVYTANITTLTAADVGPGTVNITAEKVYYRNYTAISPLVAPIEFRQHTVLENLTFSVDVDNAVYHTDAFNITVDLQNTTLGNPTGSVPNAQIIAYSNHTDVNNTQFGVFPNGITFWLEVNTTDLAATGTFSLNITFKQLFFEPHFNDTETFTIRANPTHLTAWTHLHNTVVDTVYYHPTDNHSFFVHWEDSHHNEPVDATTVDINSSKVTAVTNSTPGGQTFEFFPNATGIDVLNRIQITLSRSGYESLIYLVIFDIQETPTLIAAESPGSSLPNSTIVGSTLSGLYYWEDNVSLDLISGANIVISVNGSIPGYTTVFEVSPGLYNITLDMSAQPWACYNISLQFSKYGYITQTKIIYAYILGWQVDLELIFADTLVKGEDFVLEAQLSRNITSGLALLQLSGPPITGEDVTFTVTVLLENGTQKTYTGIEPTNQQGIARFVLSRAITAKTKQLIGIEVEYAGSATNQGQKYVVSSEGFPLLKSPPQEVPLTEQLWDYIQENLVYITIGSILMLAFLAVSGQKFRTYQQVKRKRQAIERSLQELRTMRSIIIRHRDGVRLYSQSVFGSEESRDDAIAGMSAAISAFLQEVATGSVRAGESASASTTEFVRMEQRGLHMLQRNDKYTVIIVISEAPLGKFTEDNIRILQQTLEKDFSEELAEFFSSDQIPEEDLADLVDRNLYVGLLGAVRLNRAALKAQQKQLTADDRRLVREVQKIITVVPNEVVFYLDSYTSHLENRKFPKADATQFLLKGYRTGIFEALSHEELMRHRQEER